MKKADNKRQVGIRVPNELDKRLENHVKQIGISKGAFILGLIYKELQSQKANQRED